MKTIDTSGPSNSTIFKFGMYDVPTAISPRGGAVALNLGKSSSLVVSNGLNEKILFSVKTSLGSFCLGNIIFKLFPLRIISGSGNVS